MVAIRRGADGLVLFGLISGDAVDFTKISLGDVTNPAQLIANRHEHIRRILFVRPRTPKKSLPLLSFEASKYEKTPQRRVSAARGSEVDLLGQNRAQSGSV